MCLGVSTSPRCLRFNCDGGELECSYASQSHPEIVTSSLAEDGHFRREIEDVLAPREAEHITRI